MEPTPNLIIACTDLIFSTKITGTAKALAKPFAVARTDARLDELLAAATAPLVIVDMSIAALDPVAAIRRARQKPGTRVVAFLSHVEAETAAAARAAGANDVMARSAFTARLPDIIGSVPSPQ